MDNIYNSFFISFLALKPFFEKPIKYDFLIPIQGFSFNVLKASQLNSLGEDSISEYVNSIRRHFINDIVICYERYASLMYASQDNNQQRSDPALIKKRSINASKFEERNKSIYTDDDLKFVQQLRKLRNSIVHFNGVYSLTNQLDYTFHKNAYKSLGHEGENITIDFDTLIFIYKRIYSIVDAVNNRYFSIYHID